MLLPELNEERPIEFDIRVPCDNTALQSNIAYALSLGLPEADSNPIKSLRLIANGPSAKSAPLLCGETLALNGALKLFAEKGLSPTYWAGCDPQPIMAEFVKDAPRDTIYFVASKCHPSVFEALRDRDVRLWHIDDSLGLIPPGKTIRTIPSAVSVTLTAFHLMNRLGYRHFDVWGWDGCYLDGQDHAIPQSHNPDHINVDVAGRIFDTTGTWAAEAQDALHQLVSADYDLTIHGDGMIGAILSTLKVPQVKTEPRLMRAA